MGLFKRNCSACGKEFETDNLNRKKCGKNCTGGKKRVRLSTSRNGARHRKVAANDYEFVGVDGEGVDRPDGKHDYVMLSVGSNTLFEGGKELQLGSIFEFLYSEFIARRDAIYVGFFLGYDFIQWMKLLPEGRARLLLTERGIYARKSQRQSRLNPTPDPVVWNGWEFDLLAGRRLKLRPHRHHKSSYGDECRNRTCSWKAEFREIFEPKVIGDLEHLLVEPDGEMGEEITDWDDFIGKSVAPSRMIVVGKEDKEKVYPWMYICDTGAFWQSSFMSVIDPANWGESPVCSEGEYEIVKEGKEDRGHVYEYGDVSYYEDMRKYNVLENEILGRVTKRLNRGFMNDRIPIKIGKADWYGPGRAAQIWMDMLHEVCADENAVRSNRDRLRALSSDCSLDIPRENETGILNADVYMSMPPWFREAAQQSYYGGWFEQFMHGHIGPVWEYDINSAYPYIIANLPCLHTTGKHNGKYSKGKGNSLPDIQGALVLLHSTVRGSDKYIGAMPYRNRAGLISRPHVVKGWYWQDELEAAQKAGLIDNMEVHEWCAYVACTCSPPFNPESIGIESLYQLRLDVGKNSPQGKASKLVYNSAYGKTAQSIGNPKYSNAVYASRITSGCRTLILEAIASHPMGTAACSMVATDGVYFTSPHAGLKLNKEELGAWDDTKKEGMTQLMPGVYWDDVTRQRLRDKLSVKMKSRGISGRDLVKEIDRIDGLFWEEVEQLRNGGEYIWPEIEFTTGFLLDSTKSALARGKWTTAGTVTHGKTRKIKARPVSKRDTQAYLDGDVVRTGVIVHDSIETVPYDKSFGFGVEDELSKLFGGLVGPDGDPAQLIKEILYGN